MNVLKTRPSVERPVWTHLVPTAALALKDMNLMWIGYPAEVVQLKIKILGDEELFWTDIDECKKMNGGCQSSCTNTPGSFRCSCDQGYRLLDDGLNCEGKWIHFWRCHFNWLLQPSVVIQFLKLHWMVWWSVTDRQWVGLAGSPVTRATLWEAQTVGPVSPPSSGGNLLPYVTLQCALTSLLLTMDLCCSHVPERRAICVVLCVPMATA